MPCRLQEHDISERKYPEMKKIIALILVMVLLAFGLTACKKAEQIGRAHV